MQRFHQLGYVTNAIDRAREVMAEVHGIRHFRERERKLETREAGIAGSAVMHVALANTAGAQIEIIQPVAGQIGVFKDILRADAFTLTLHHIAYRFEGSHADWLGHLSSLEQAGRPAAWQSMPNSNGEFAYTDDRDRIGHFVEHVWAIEARWKEMMRAIPIN